MQHKSKWFFIFKILQSEIIFNLGLYFSEEQKSA